LSIFMRPGKRGKELLQERRYALSKKGVEKLNGRRGKAKKGKMSQNPAFGEKFDNTRQVVCWGFQGRL